MRDQRLHRGVVPLVLLAGVSALGCSQNEADKPGGRGGSSATTDADGGDSAGGRGGAGGSAEGGASGAATETGYCRDTCEKSCSADDDCDMSRGELCCDLGAPGKVCLAATLCPRFCKDDSDCDPSRGEACMRYELTTEDKVCTEPEYGLQLCEADDDCTTGNVCCGIYRESICLPPSNCPRGCTKSSACDTAQGEVCCTSVTGIEPNLSAEGLVHADALAALKVAPVVVIVPELRRRSSRTPEGRRVVQCPYYSSGRLHCSTCGLCARRDRDAIVALPAHGARAGSVARLCRT